MTLAPPNNLKPMESLSRINKPIEAVYFSHKKIQVTDPNLRKITDHVTGVKLI